MKSKIKTGTIACLISALLVFSAGCVREAAEKTAELAYSKEYHRGPLRVTIQVDRITLSLADELTIRIIASLQEEYRLDPQQFGADLEGFGIRDYRTEPGRLDSEGRMVETRWYRLEPFFTGQLQLPALTFTFRKQIGEETDEDKVYTLTTEAVEVEVTSLLEKDRENLVLQPPRGVVDIPRERSYLLGWIAGGLLLLLALLGFIIRRLLRPRIVPVAIVPAHTRALARLQRLLEEELLERGEIKPFYYLLSEIFRYYLEDRYGLRASEQTSEEFLQDLAASTEITGPYKQTLRLFLERTDPVKYASMIPVPEDIQDVFNMVKSFIVETTQEAPVSAAVRGGGDRAIC